MKIKVTDENAGLRLDQFLAEHASLKLSRSYIKTLVSKEKILVNSKASKASYKLRLGDEIDLEIPEPEKLEIEAENIALDIVFEDEDLMVINKAAGMVVHPAPSLNSGTLVNAVMYHCKDSLSDINGKLRPGIVHRLDKDTTGLILVAKSNQAHQSLSEQIQNRSCKRIYNAIVHENFKADQGEIIKPIGRHPKEGHKMFCFNDLNDSPNARYAKTNYRILKRFEFKSKKFTLLECQLDTGRTHQIRVHMSFLKHPILGDSSYSAPESSVIKANRPMLHAKKISFSHPVSSEELNFEIDLPDDFHRILKILN